MRLRVPTAPWQNLYAALAACKQAASVESLSLKRPIMSYSGCQGTKQFQCAVLAIRLMHTQEWIMEQLQLRPLRIWPRAFIPDGRMSEAQTLTAEADADCYYALECTPQSAVVYCLEMLREQDGTGSCACEALKDQAAAECLHGPR